MSLQNVISILSNHLTIALLFTPLVGIFLLLTIRKFSNNHKQSIKGAILSIFILYVLVVLSATLLNRSSTSITSAQLGFLSSYQEAWQLANVRQWQFIILNICMFIPFGFFLPFLHSIFRKLWPLFIAATVFTLLIELLQLTTGRGIFEVDDLFNNILGAIIGFGIAMAAIQVKNCNFRLASVYMIPVLLVPVIFLGIFTTYQLKEFGNLSFVPSTSLDMEAINVTLETQLETKATTATLYQAPHYSKQEAEHIVRSIFEKWQLDPTNMKQSVYSESGSYSTDGEPSYHMWFTYLGGSYDLSTFHFHEDEKPDLDISEGELRGELALLGIEIPKEALFEEVDNGFYQWSVEHLIEDGALLNGAITVNYHESIKSLSNGLIRYEPVSEVELITESEAFKQVEAGRFRQPLSGERMDHFIIKEVRLDYFLDSKGFYQPVYAFVYSYENDEKEILIEAMK